MNNFPPTPKSIKESIAAVPPLQRHHVMDSFKNIQVEWDLKFNDVYGLPDENGDLNLLLRGEDDTILPIIRVPSNINLYPELSRFEAGLPIRVKGRIKDMDDMKISLKDCTLTFPGMSKRDASASLENLGTIIHHASQVHFGSGDNNIHPSTQIKDGKKEWYERPLGVVALLVIAGLIVAYTVYWFHWTP